MCSRMRGTAQPGRTTAGPQRAWSQQVQPVQAAMQHTLTSRMAASAWRLRGVAAAGVLWRPARPQPVQLEAHVAAFGGVQRPGLRRRLALCEARALRVARRGLRAERVTKRVVDVALSTAAASGAPARTGLCLRPAARAHPGHQSAPRTCTDVCTAGLEPPPRL